MNFPPTLTERFFIGIAISLIGFGTINLVVLSYAQQVETPQQEEPWREKITLIVIERLLLEVGPIVGGAVMIGVNFARKKGLVISAEAEEYFVNSVKSFVSEQSRWMYEQLRDNRKHWEELDKGQNVHEGGIPKSLGMEAKRRVIDRLLVELKSDEFTKTAKSMLKENLDSLVERMVTEHNKEIANRGRQIIFDLAPLAVDAALLSFRTKDEMREKTDAIVDSALTSIKKRFDFEEVAYDGNLVVMAIKAELRKRIDSQDHTQI